jgi:hypothetical protein
LLEIVGWWSDNQFQTMHLRMASASTHVCCVTGAVAAAAVFPMQVCAMRMPVDMLMIWLPQILEGMLIWADDSKNKFRLKVRQLKQPECVDIKELLHHHWLLHNHAALLASQTGVS